MESLRDSLLEFVTPAVLWVVFILVLLVFAAISTALMYHWKNYNVNSAVGRRIRKAYFFVSGGFIFAILVALIAYST